MTRSKLYILIASGALLLIFVWFYQNTRLEITIRGSSTEKFNVQIKNGDKTNTFTTTATTIKRLVKRGDVEVTVRTTNTSYLRVVHTGSFFSTTKVSATLTPENARTFVGDNPAPCMQSLGVKLVSYGCFDTFNRINFHVPATQNQPTYVRQRGGRITNTVVGIVNTKGGRLVILRSGYYTAPQYYAYSTDNNLNLSAPRRLVDMSGAEPYSITPYKEGFVAYNSTFSDILYYASPANPIKLSIPAPKDKQVTPYALSSHDDTIAIMYATGKGEALASDATKSDQSKTIIETISSSHTKEYTVNGKYGQASICGHQKLCLLSAPRLDIYDISGSKPRKLYSMYGINSFENNGNHFRILRNSEIINFDLDNRQGYVSYSYGAYKPCGSQNAPRGYLLCVINPRSKKVALYLDETKTDDSQIDKKILYLLQSVDIKDVSINGSYVYISPQLGLPAYNGRNYTYSTSTKEAVAHQIEAAVIGANIDTNKFRIINTIP